MRTCSGQGSWRAVMLRGVCPSSARGGPEVLVLLSADQYLRVPVPRGEEPAWQSLVGRRVWVDPERGVLRAGAPVVQGCGHAC